MLLCYFSVFSSESLYIISKFYLLNKKAPLPGLSLNTAPAHAVPYSPSIKSKPNFRIIRKINIAWCDQKNRRLSSFPTAYSLFKGQAQFRNNPDDSDARRPSLAGTEPPGIRVARRTRSPSILTYPAPLTKELNLTALLHVRADIFQSTLPREERQ
jgi:hypothetical protein